MISRAVALLAVTPAFALAEEVPLWTAGAGLGAVTFPAYRGADKVYTFVLPTPYFTYHGKFLKADRHGVRGEFFDSDRLALTLSLSASPPTFSGDIAAREGMDDLRPTFEVGPQMEITLWRSEQDARLLKLRLPVRTAYTVESAPRHAGWIFSPNLNLDITDLPALPGWNLGVVAGPIYATEAQHDFFYGVAPEAATAARSAYNARGGYSGTQFITSLSKRYRDHWVGAFVRYDSLHGAVFEDSPLAARRDFFMAGMSVAWIFGSSKVRVSGDE